MRINKSRLQQLIKEETKKLLSEIGPLRLPGEKLLGGESGDIEETDDDMEFHDFDTINPGTYGRAGVPDWLARLFAGADTAPHIGLKRAGHMPWQGSAAIGAGEGEGTDVVRQSGPPGWRGPEQSQGLAAPDIGPSLLMDPSTLAGGVTGLVTSPLKRLIPKIIKKPSATIGRAGKSAADVEITPLRRRVSDLGKPPSSAIDRNLGDPLEVAVLKRLLYYNSIIRKRVSKSIGSSKKPNIPPGTTADNYLDDFGDVSYSKLLNGWSNYHMGKKPLSRMEGWPATYKDVLSHGDAVKRSGDHLPGGALPRQLPAELQ